MIVKFKSLNLENFKNHQEQSVNFGERTDILGDNAEGKSTFGESISWLLYGTDLMGSKLDPTPDTYEADSTRVDLLLVVDGKETKLGRQILKGRNKYYMNDVPSKATEFNEVVERLFDRELFLSLFNPTFFFTMQWEKQREMVLRYVTPPANKEVFAEMPKAQADKLAELVKKHSLEDLNKIHRDNKNRKDKAHVAAESRTKTLKEQLGDYKRLVPLESLQVEKAQLEKECSEIEEVTNGASDTNEKINALNYQIKQLLDKRDQMREHWIHLKDEKIEKHCKTCKQFLQEESIKEVEADKERRIQEFKKEFDGVVSKRVELEEELAKLEYVDVSEQLAKSRELQDKIAPIEAEISKHHQLESLQEMLKEAEENEKETLESLNNSIFIIDSIKDFYAKEAELQAKKVQDLFETLSIRLFTTVKSTGELKPAFVIQMDGKDYIKLSTAERIKAGLELRDVLSEQSNIVVPTFVDNAESITKFKEPNGQLILARVVEGKKLEVVSSE